LLDFGGTKRTTHAAYSRWYCKSSIYWLWNPTVHSEAWWCCGKLPNRDGRD